MDMTGSFIGTVKTIFLNGEVEIDIGQKDDEYDVDIRYPAPMQKMKMNFSSITADENSLVGIGELSVMPGKTAQTKITFEETGRIKAYTIVPMLGKVVLKKVHRVETAEAVSK